MLDVDANDLSFGIYVNYHAVLNLPGIGTGTRVEADVAKRFPDRSEVS